MTVRALGDLPWWVNTAWLWRCRGEAAAFRTDARRVRAVQERLLRATLRDNAASTFGRAHAFSSIRSLDDFRSNVPISNYDTLAAAIDRTADGEPRVLTAEPVLMFEPTGGSSGGSKLIPYTATLRRQFQRAIDTWMWDVLRHVPAVRAGRAYWSISPAVQRERRTRGGTRIGFDSDHEYVDGLQRWALSRLLVVPPAAAQFHGIENFRYATLRYLLAADDLALVSVWSPTFLTALVDALREWVEPLCRDLRDGTLRLPCPDQEAVVPRVRFSPRRARAHELTKVMGGNGTAPQALTRLWPRLALISCWADAAAEMYVSDLQSRFPGIPIQPKGLLATEGVVSVPVVGQVGAALAIRSHVFEFLELANDDDGGSAHHCTLLADELQKGRRYRVLLTTGGGLYRYDLGDVIEVVGYLDECPLLRFRGRDGPGSDLVGEKLHERHVRECLRATFEEFAIQPDFAMVVPQTAPAGYVALVDSCRRAEASDPAPDLARRLESRLRQNPQYRYAVDLHQLRPIEVRWLEGRRGHAWRIYERRCRELGQKSGDIKPTALDGRPGWTEVFQRK